MKKSKYFQNLLDYTNLVTFAMNSKFKLISFLTFLIAICNSPAYAYAGPGAAIGAILVALTVIVAFFSSLIIKLFNFFKITLKFLQRKFKAQKKLKKKI